MSVLETPRIVFRGQVTWDPIVTNNYPTNYDEDTGEAILPAAADKVKAFREQAIGQVTGGNWNPQGTHRSTFFDTAVCGFDGGAGVRTDDPFVSAAVSLTGMLVDVEPFGAFSSQLFFDVMQFGVDGGYRILAPRTSRFTARYINFMRNPANGMIAGIASVIWQASFVKADGLRVDPFNSRALQRLAAALEDDDALGLTVRFNTYRTVYFDNPDLSNTSPLTRQAQQLLASKLTAGGFQPIRPAVCSSAWSASGARASRRTSPVTGPCCKIRPCKIPRWLPRMPASTERRFRSTSPTAFRRRTGPRPSRIWAP